MNHTQMSDLLDSAVMGAEYLCTAMEQEENSPVVSEVLSLLYQTAAIVEKEMEGTSHVLRQVHLYGKNIQSSIDDLKDLPTHRGQIAQHELRPFSLEMCRLWHYATEILPYADRRTIHLEELMAASKALHKAEEHVYQYDVSIVLCGYNKLAYTQKAVESIMTHTDFSGGNVELIVINNGSNDGTREYFGGLPHVKCINLKYNILGMNAAQHLAGGKYFVSFANDVVATPHWLEHLLACMKSDDRIAIAVPTCNDGGISSFQGVSVSYPNTFEGMEAMQRFAEEYNRNLVPAYWEDRSQLMPFLSIIRTDVYRMGLIDPVYTRGEFVDDDLSTLLRRTGWRQVLLKDTFMHHFGGVTLGAERKRGAGYALDEMRRVYYEKWGVDAWESRGEFYAVEDLWGWNIFHEDDSILVLEPRFGNLSCRIFNMYRQHGMQPYMTAVVFDRRYRMDTDYLFDATVEADCVEDAARTEQEYNLISAGCYLDELPARDLLYSLELLYGKLAPGGTLLLPVRNPDSAYEITCLLDEGGRDLYEGEGKIQQYSCIPYRTLLDVLRTHPLLHDHKTYFVAFERDLPAVERVKPLLYVDESSRAEAELSLSVRMFFLGIFKKT